MNLRTKANLVGSIAILCVIVGIILAFSLAILNQNISGIIIFISMYVYSCLKDEYLDLRCKEIDKEIDEFYKNK